MLSPLEGSIRALERSRSRKHDGQRSQLPSCFAAAFESLELDPSSIAVRSLPSLCNEFSICQIFDLGAD